MARAEAKVALILGIVAIVFALWPTLSYMTYEIFSISLLLELSWIFPFIAFPIAIVGITLAIVARKEEKSSIAKVGLIISVIGFVLSLSTSVACYVLVSYVMMN